MMKMPCLQYMTDGRWQTAELQRLRMNSPRQHKTCSAYEEENNTGECLSRFDLLAACNLSWLEYLDNQSLLAQGNRFQYSRGE